MLRSAATLVWVISILSTETRVSFREYRVNGQTDATFGAVAVGAAIILRLPLSASAQSGARTNGAAPASTATTSDTGYVPAQDFPNGRQIEAVYFGANWCSPCRAPSMKAAVRAMKPPQCAQ